MRCLVVIFLATAVAACNTTPALHSGQTGHIVEVSVTKRAESQGTRNLAEDIRVKTLNAAYHFPETGPALKLEVVIDLFIGVSPARAALTNSSSMLTTKITVVDQATGAAKGPFDVYAHNMRPGGLLGIAAGLGVDPIDDERDLARQLARKIMERVYGKKHAATVANGIPRKQAVANYPYAYADEALRLECDFLRVGNQAVIEDAKEAGDDNPQLREIPPECDKVL